MNIVVLALILLIPAGVAVPIARRLEPRHLQRVAAATLVATFVIGSSGDTDQIASSIAGRSLSLIHGSRVSRNLSWAFSRKMT